MLEMFNFQVGSGMARPKIKPRCNKGRGGGGEGGFSGSLEENFLCRNYKLL